MRDDQYNAHIAVMTGNRIRDGMGSQTLDTIHTIAESLLESDVSPKAAPYRTALLASLQTMRDDILYFRDEEHRSLDEDTKRYISLVVAARYAMDHVDAFADQLPERAADSLKGSAKFIAAAWQFAEFQASQEEAMTLRHEHTQLYDTVFAQQLQIGLDALYGESTVRARITSDLEAVWQQCPNYSVDRDALHHAETSSGRTVYAIAQYLRDCDAVSKERAEGVPASDDFFNAVHRITENAAIISDYAHGMGHYMMSGASRCAEYREMCELIDHAIASAHAEALLACKDFEKPY